MDMIFRRPMDSNARAADNEIDPYTWVLLAEEAIREHRRVEAITLIEEAFNVHDERQAKCPLEQWQSSAVEEIAEADL